LGRPGKKGNGQISTETGALERYTSGFASRFEDARRGRDQLAGHARNGGCMNGAATVETREAALAAADHVLGDVHAKLTLLEYGNYECPACIQAEPLMQHLVDTHRGRLRFVPLLFDGDKLQFAVTLGLGMALVLLSVRRGPILERYGAWNRLLV
jgi:hypothetical protein